MTARILVSFVIILVLLYGTTTGLISSYSPSFSVHASVEDEAEIPDTSKHDTDKDGTSDDQDTDDDNDGTPDQQDDDDDNDNVPDEDDTDDDNDNVPDDRDADDDNDNLPDDQDTDDDNDGIPDEEEIIPTPTPIPTPAVDNDTILADDNDTIPTPIPTEGNATQQNGTQQIQTAKLQITTYLRANCGDLFSCKTGFETDGVVKVVVSPDGRTETFTPHSTRSGGINYYSMDIPIGEVYDVYAREGLHQNYFRYQGALMGGGACHVDPFPIDQGPCSAVMPPRGDKVDVHFYYECLMPFC